MSQTKASNDFFTAYDSYCDKHLQIPRDTAQNAADTKLSKPTLKTPAHECYIYMYYVPLFNDEASINRAPLYRVKDLITHTHTNTVDTHTHAQTHTHTHAIDGTRLLQVR